MSIDATDSLADSQPLFDEALVTVHRFRPELVQVDATVDLVGSPTMVARILEVHPQARVTVLGEDPGVDLLLANEGRRRRHRRKDLWGDHGTAGGRGRVGRQRPLEPVPGGPIKLG